MDEKKQWGQIQNGKKITFRTASEKRYRTEGKLKKNGTKSKQGSESKQGSAIVKKEEAKKEEEIVEPIFNPAKPISSKKIKSQPIVKSIENEGKNTIVVIDNSKEGYNELIQIIRKWKIG